jgi:hypothetical protein
MIIFKNEIDDKFEYDLKKKLWRFNYWGFGRKN